jgi:hypothetical protein
MLAEIRRHPWAVLPVVTLIPVPYLAFDGMMVEIEGYAMRSAAGRWMPRAMAAPQVTLVLALRHALPARRPLRRDDLYSGRADGSGRTRRGPPSRRHCRNPRS